MKSLENNSDTIKKEEVKNKKIKIIDIPLKSDDINKNTVKVKLPRSESCL